MQHYEEGFLIRGAFFYFMSLRIGLPFFDFLIIGITPQ